MHDDLVMEVAILLDDISLYKGIDINNYHFEWGSSENGIKKAISMIRKTITNSHITHLYYGNEFCEYRLPTKEQLYQFFEIVKMDNIKPVLVTSPVSDWGIERIVCLLDELKKFDKTAAVVVNDAGVLELIHTDYGCFQLILGRVFDKTSHDPRASITDFSNYYGNNGLEFAKTPGIVSESSLSVYSKYNMSRMEFDLPKVGLQLPNDINASLYWPYQYLTTGRICAIRATQYMDNSKFLISDYPCSQPCQMIQIEKRKPVNGFAFENGVRLNNRYLFQRGNTLFYLYAEKDFDEVVHQFNRIIIQV